MKQLKICIFTAILSLGLLSGCAPVQSSGDRQLEVVPPGKEGPVNTPAFEVPLEGSTDDTAPAADTTRAKEAFSATEADTQTQAAEPEYIQEYYFKSKKTRDSHFKKHGAEFGGIYKSPEEYETGADKAAHAPNALHKLEKEDNDDVYYIEETNEFVIVSPDGYIRTYFKPSAGKKYFDRQ